MAENLSDKVRTYLNLIQGRTIEIGKLRNELRVDPHSPAWEGIRVIAHRLVEEKILKPSGKQDGVYKVVMQVQPVQVFGQARERRPVFDLRFPKDFDRGMEMDFSEFIVVREGDLITIGGVKSKSKTALCLSFCAENIERNYSGLKETAACRRASLDLTRVLAQLRSGKLPNKTERT